MEGRKFLLTPLREGRRRWGTTGKLKAIISTHAPAGGATDELLRPRKEEKYFYSRPCGRGDAWDRFREPKLRISTHAPAGGATLTRRRSRAAIPYFYSRPCGRGDRTISTSPTMSPPFLLTPLREGRPAPAGGVGHAGSHFYSRPCGRGDWNGRGASTLGNNFYSRPCGRGDASTMLMMPSGLISTHAPAGGATAIFHKSVMRFCGKLPKDDTVLCLASFGFPRRDPKAVYLAWISCANLPQKCVREGLALKDQGTSCFHEGLASHAFDPVLV